MQIYLHAYSALLAVSFWTLLLAKGEKKHLYEDCFFKQMLKLFSGSR